ncbi:SubName: Full=Uncharacterized protein {ECO:0000313/EMBL:CCA70937.1} [Serendipita indica DSM 11827]|nr:SubName: Full=Uncharacterized protein {ECO:0000313/EMBL:CCA70937.1} [Serendipita indica DSM 11827]
MSTPVKDLVNVYESKTTSPEPSPSPARFLKHPAARTSTTPSKFTKASSSRSQDVGNPFLGDGEHGGLELAEYRRSNTGSNTRRQSTLPARSSLGMISSNDLRVGSPSSMSPVVTSPTRAAHLREPPALHHPSSNPFADTLDSVTYGVSKFTKPEPKSSARRTDDTRFPSPSAYSPIPDHDFNDYDSFSATAISSRSVMKHHSLASIPLIDRSLPPTTPKTTSPDPSLDQHGHKPIPAKKVFSRSAVPLYLPHLDKLLGDIQPPAFTTALEAGDIPLNSKGDKASEQIGMFPPLDRLKGKTLDELHHNSPLPAWYRDKSSLLNSIVTGIIGIAGSSAIASYYSLQGLYDGVQIFALVLSSVVPRSSFSATDRWRELFLSTIPNILALNIPTKLTQSLIFLAIFMVICGFLLYRFYQVTNEYRPSAFREGLQARQPPATWGIIAVSFVLTVLYLPLSTIAMHGILWSSDFWVVPNPYQNGTKAAVQLLGPPEVWRDPMDFCYTTTMRKDEVNYAPVIVAMSVATFILMTLWFPIRLMQTIRQALPRVDPYTELGRKRSRPEMELEYQRLLERDQNPFAFLYRDFRRSWGEYKSVYLWAKLSALLIVAVLSPDNCAFRSFKRDTIDIVRQSVLTLSMLIWFLLQCFLVPFLDPVSNASEWTSRLNYLLTSGLGLFVALDAPAKAALNGVVLYIIYAVTYGLDFYFAIIGTGFMRRIMKKITRRVDFSIDIFSPKLDLTINSPHLRRRIWQESIGTIILTDEGCRIPLHHQMQFSEAINFEWPPYLLNFAGSPGERHVENLKILREEGLKKYARAVAMISGPDAKLFELLRDRIERHFIGPDCYWRPDNDDTQSEQHGFFGNAWWIPFPPTLVIRYDQGGQAVLESLHELEHYVFQNEDPSVRFRRDLRMALRCLDAQIVIWPYKHIEPVGSRTWFSGRRYTMQKTTHFHSCVFSIRRRGIQYWKDLPIGSGFDVELRYNKDVHLDGDAIGLADEFHLTPTLAHFLHLNRHLIQLHQDGLERKLKAYRKECRKVAKAKQRVLTYGFLTQVYNWPLQPKQVVDVVEKEQADLRVREMFAANVRSLEAAGERMKYAGRSEITVWWFLFWDDFWRRNHDTVAALQKFPTDFNPHFSVMEATSLLSRLSQQTLLSIESNRVPQYRQRILIHVGDGEEEMDLNDLDLTTHVRSSSMGTGGGTDLDDASIRIRNAFKWEDVFDDTVHKGHRPLSQYLHWKSWKNMLAVWFGVTPLSHRRLRTNGIALDVEVDSSGRYIVIERRL